VRRLTTNDASTIKMQLRVTPEERDEIRALARYLNSSMSDLLRRLLAEERRRLIDQGLRPPRK
jgi:cell division protein ZapA (FtsZ GTPase activity inhibitor)